MCCPAGCVNECYRLISTVASESLLLSAPSLYALRSHHEFLVAGQYAGGRRHCHQAGRRACWNKGNQESVGFDDKARRHSIKGNVGGARETLAENFYLLADSAAKGQQSHEGLCPDVEAVENAVSETVPM